MPERGLEHAFRPEIAGHVAEQFAHWTIGFEGCVVAAESVSCADAVVEACAED